MSRGPPLDAAVTVELLGEDASSRAPTTARHGNVIKEETTETWPKAANVRADRMKPHHRAVNVEGFVVALAGVRRPAEILPCRTIVDAGENVFVPFGRGFLSTRRRRHCAAAWETGHVGVDGAVGGSATAGVELRDTTQQFRFDWTQSPRAQCEEVARRLEAAQRRVADNTAANRQSVQEPRQAAAAAVRGGRIRKIGDEIEAKQEDDDQTWFYPAVVVASGNRGAKSHLMLVKWKDHSVDHDKEEDLPYGRIRDRGEWCGRKVMAIDSKYPDDPPYAAVVVAQHSDGRVEVLFEDLEVRNGKAFEVKQIKTPGVDVRLQ
jgi:hypothetical protein